MSCSRVFPKPQPQTQSSSWRLHPRSCWAGWGGRLGGISCHTLDNQEEEGEDPGWPQWDREIRGLERKGVKYRNCSQATLQLSPLPQATCASIYTLFLTQKLPHLWLWWGAGAEKLSCSFGNSKKNKCVGGWMGLLALAVCPQTPESVPGLSWLCHTGQGKAWP